MSAQGLRINPVVISNDPSKPSREQVSTVELDDTLGFTLQTTDIRTLSTNGASSGGQIGLLYIPELTDSEACVQASEPYVPANVTRIDDLAPGFNILAVAPWTSGDCALQYMQAARNNDAVQGFLFFIPSIAGMPPDNGDSVWDIGGNRRWRGDNGYPVYAISSDNGARLLNESVLYNQVPVDVPSGEQVVERYPNAANVNLLARINTSSTQNLPSLWVFLLVVLAILLTVIGITSLTMHLIQRRRRTSLRRRVANGEVDLESLGIKRLTVPQAVLEKMPLYTYGTVGRQDNSETDSLSKGAITVENTARTHRTRASNRSIGYNPTALSQPTCPICLDDFEVASAESEGTTVRELPCHHIFHPECVDVFLRDNSSLCPMCKETALPKGYCPALITNAMVRRERMVRRLAQSPENIEMQPNLEASSRSRLRARLNGLRGQQSAPETVGQPVNSTTPVDTTTQPTPVNATTVSPPAVPPPAQPLSSSSRQEWARQRALSMVGRDNAPVDPDADEAQRTPKWKKALRKIFPFGR